MALVSQNQVEKNRAELIVKVGPERFKKAVDVAFYKNAKSITLPGFRKGKAPRAMIEKAYGKESFYSDAMNDVYPEAYSAAVEEAGIDPVDAADVEVVEVNDDGFTFKATVTTKPVPELGKYKGVAATKLLQTVTDEEIDRQLTDLREKSARILTISDRAAKDGDIADINFEGFLDGVAFEGGNVGN